MISTPHSARRLFDHRPRVRAKVGADVRRLLDDDDPDGSVASQNRAQAIRHFGDGFDARKAASGDHDRVARDSLRTVCEGFQVRVERCGRSPTGRH